MSSCDLLLCHCKHSVKSPSHFLTDNLPHSTKWNTTWRSLNDYVVFLQDFVCIITARKFSCERSHQVICKVQYIPRNMHTVFALLCFVVVIHWLIFPYPSGLLHWHCSNLTIAPVPAKQHWWIWINTSCEFIMNDCITITKQSTTKPCAYFLGYTACFLDTCWPLLFHPRNHFCFGDYKVKYFRRLFKDINDLLHWGNVQLLNGYCKIH